MHRLSRTASFGIHTLVFILRLLCTRDESAGLDEGDDLFDNGDGDSDSRPKKSKKRKEGYAM